MMEALPPFLRVSRGAALWTLAGAVWVHGALRRFEPEGAWLVAAVLGLALGTLPLLAGRGLRGLPGALLRGGLPLAFLALVCLPLLDWLEAAAFTPSALAFHLLVFGLIGLAALLEPGCASRVRVLIGVEWLKLRRGRLLRVGLGVAVLGTLLAGWSHDPLDGESGWAVAAHAMGAGFWTAEVLLLVMGATAVAGELGQGTMKMVLPHAYRRAEWVTAKATVLLFAAALFTVLVAIAGLAHAGLTLGLGDVVKVVPVGFGEDDELQVFQTAAQMRGHLGDFVTTAGASLVASAMLGLLLSCLFDSLVPALSASFLLFVAVKVGDILLGFSRPILDALYAQYPEEMRTLTIRLGRGFNERWDERLEHAGLHLALLTAAFGLLVATRLFGRRDLHG